VPSALQAHLQPVGHRGPITAPTGKGQRDEAPAQLREHLLDQALIAGEADLQRVFEHQRQQLRQRRVRPCFPAE